MLELVLIFYIYSLAGWCMEVTLKYFQYHRFINRGFLTGPICPIYGSGAVLITTAVGALTRWESSIGTTFAVSFLLCGLLEYLTSYFMEKRMHARWWDYSQKPMNLHGRVWIGNLLLFGLGGVAIVHLINPLLYSLLSSVPLLARQITAGALSCVFLADNIMTHLILRLVRIGIEQSEADNTEEIAHEIRLLLSDKTLFHRRFIEAYPEVVYRTDRINARIAAVKAETERLRQEAEHRRAQVMSAIEPAAMIKNTIISKQDQLIGMLYAEDTAGEEEKALKAEIDHEKERLAKKSIAL